MGLDTGPASLGLGLDSRLASHCLGFDMGPNCLDLGLNMSPTCLDLLHDIDLSVFTRAWPIYRFADVIGQYWPIADTSVSAYTFSNKC